MASCKFEHMITSEKYLSYTRNYLEPMISAVAYYWFWKDMHTLILKLWLDKEIWQDKEGLLFNNVGISVY